LVVALGALLVALSLPTAVTFYQSVVAADAADEITMALRSASRDAVLGKNDIAHGVNITSAAVTIFQGPSYALRVTSADMVIPLVSGVSLSGLPAEIVFAKLSGMPSATGTLTMSLYGKTHTIHIDDNSLITTDE
jgi:type II secretory pathway pseudopilin PulG